MEKAFVRWGTKFIICFHVVRKKIEVDDFLKAFINNFCTVLA